MRIPFVGDIPEARRQARASQPEPVGEAGTVHKLEECYQASDSARRQFEGEWVDNILFLEGRQWEKAAEDVRRGRKLPVRAPESRVQMTANWTYTLARQAVAGLRDNLAEQIAVPATADPADEAAAEVATDWLAFQYDQDGEDARRYHEILWAMVTGRSVRKSTWDPSRDGLGLVRGAKVTLPRAGDIASVSLNPWRFHVDPWSETFEEASYVIESDVRDVQEINDLYPGHAVAAEEVAVGLGMVQGLANASLRGGGGYAQRRKEAAVLKRMYCRPTTKYPKGRVYTWANGKLLQTRDLPEGEMPFVALDWFYIPGRLVPLAFITPIRDPQREYNITLSQLVELKNRQLRGDLVIQGAVNEDDVTQDVDPVTGWKRTRLAPHVQSYELMQYNLNPSTAEMLLARFWEDGQQAAGVRDPSLGCAGRGDAGKTLGGLMLLRESDTQGLSLFRVGFDRAYCAIARQKLLLARNHYKVPRMVRVVGLSDAPKVRAFLGSDLRNTEDIKARPRVMVTETQKAQIRQQLAGMGVFGPYQGPAHKHAMMTVLLNSGLPFVREEVDRICAPMSYEELGVVCGEIDALQAHVQILGLKGAIAAALQQQGSEEAIGR